MATAGRRSRRASGWPHPQAEGVRVRDSSRRVGLSPSSQLCGCGMAAAWRRWCRPQPTAYCSIDSQKLLVVHTYLLVAHFQDYSRTVTAKVRKKGQKRTAVLPMTGSRSRATRFYHIGHVRLKAPVSGRVRSRLVGADDRGKEPRGRSASSPSVRQGFGAWRGYLEEERAEINNWSIFVFAPFQFHLKTKLRITECRLKA